MTQNPRAIAPNPTGDPHVAQRMSGSLTWSLPVGWEIVRGLKIQTKPGPPKSLRRHSALA